MSTTDPIDSIDQLVYLEGIEQPRKGSIVIDPFTGDGAMMKWVGDNNIKLMYDDDPQQSGVIRRDSLIVGVQWAGSFIVTRLPMKRRSEAETDPASAHLLNLYDRWGTDDLYKCFLKSMMRSYPLGGVVILPAEFLTSYRKSDTDRRINFFRAFNIKRANIFTDRFLPGTKHLPMAIEFYRRENMYAESSEYRVKTLTVNVFPSNKTVSWTYDSNAYTCPLMNALRDLPEIPKNKFIKTRSINTDKVPTTVIKSTETLTNIFFHITDLNDRPIQVAYLDEDPLYANYQHRLVIRGPVSKKLQRRLVDDINDIINKWREETQTLFVIHLQNPRDKNKPIPFLNTRLIEKAATHLIYSYLL